MAPVRTHGGNPWAVMRTHRLSRAQLVDFSVDVNPLGFPPRLREILLAHLDEIRDYPDPDAVALREAIAEAHRVPSEAVLPGNGSAELITLIARLRPWAQALVVVPTFTEYAWTLTHHGCDVATLATREDDAFRVDTAPETWAALLDGVEVVFLCNPNNPTGAALPKPEVLALARRCQTQGTLLVVDEAFVELTQQPGTISVLPDAPAVDNIVVLRSLTKTFAIPGLRLGYLVASPELIESLRARQSAWPLNTFALAVGPSLFEETAYLQRTRAVIARWRGELMESLRAIGGLDPFPSETNFLLCKLTTPALTAEALAERLSQRGVLIRACDDFDGLEPGRFLRVAVRSPEDNDRLLDALRHALYP